MTNATIIDTVTITVEYNANVTAASLTASDFGTGPVGFIPVSVSQNGADGVDLNFLLVDVSAETDLTYGGAAPGFLSPQTIALT